MQNQGKAAKAISMFCRLYINTKKEMPIRAGEMGLLIYLVKENSEAQPIQIADFFKVSKPMVTAMINSLESKGYISKTQSSKDKRGCIVSPTEKATIFVESTYHEYNKTIQKLIEGLGETDFMTLVKLIEKSNVILLGTE